MNFISKYFDWLQKGNPTGEVERYPEIDQNSETSVKGIFIIGDLTGIPLLKLAAENGKKIIDQFIADKSLKSNLTKKDSDVKDFIIIGAGPAGVAAGIEALRYNYDFTILEASKKFNTIINFPKGKPIFAEPNDVDQESSLKINDGSKESLLKELHSTIKEIALPIDENIYVEKIEKSNGIFHIRTKEKVYKSVRVILAIGKSGNARLLNVPGENLPKVYNRLFDPADAKDQDVLIVGGGDSALETAIATADYAKSVTLSYRKSEFSRPKEGNSQRFNQLIKSKKVDLKLQTEIEEIKEKSVVLRDKNRSLTEIPNSMVFTMVGRELPTDFFKRSKIKMEGELSLTAKLQFLLLILISGVIYFGKSSADLFEYFFGSISSVGNITAKIFSSEFLIKFVALPAYIIDFWLSGKIPIWNATKYFNAFVAYFCFILAVLLGAYLLSKFIKENYRTFKFDWNTFKYSYFILVGIFFIVVFFSGKYFGFYVLDKSQGFWYTALYSVTILIFGLRRMHLKPTKYIKLQTWTLILIQAIPLFILPEILLPILGKMNLLGSDSGFLLSQVFPNESYWRAYGFILAWPLNFSNLYNGNITTFWLIFSLFQTFVFIPYIVYRWGKGAYCGWICSCGAMAETLGDEYRTLAPHGEKAKRLENIGQWILLAAFVITGLKLIGSLNNINIPILNESISYSADFMQKFYYVGIDVIFAGVLGVGVYFFLSGRVWCRFGCPLAALMHIYNRFSRYRIFSEKKKCISCNICTKVCHMGIDVMNFANKGIPMNDVECVRCSACVVNCPTQVLSFGSLPKVDLDNEYYKENELSLSKNSWKSGL